MLVKGENVQSIHNPFDVKAAGGEYFQKTTKNCDVFIDTITICIDNSHKYGILLKSRGITQNV